MSVVNRRVGLRKPLAKKYGSWRVLGELTQKHGRLAALCQCKCGAKIWVRVQHLRGGKTSGCHTCTRGGMLSHGESRNPAYRCWHSMFLRCYNKSHVSYQAYGGRGILVAEEWRGESGLLRFLEHVGPRPSAQHTIDRIDNNGHYEPGNVRWATRTEQARNRSDSHYVTANGQTLIVADWAKNMGVAPAVIHSRIKRGWSEEKAVTTPPRCWRRS